MTEVKLTKAQEDAVIELARSIIRRRKAEAAEVEPELPGMPSRRKAAALGKREIPENWWPDDQLLDWWHARPAIESLEETVARFRDYHRAKGSRFKDWRAAFRQWCRNQVKFAEQDARASGNRVIRDL